MSFKLLQIKKSLTALSLILSVALLLGGVSLQQLSASKGVGVGTAEINVDEDLSAGGRYELPPVTVVNTGDEKADYNFIITYLEGQEEQRPPLDWFTISPTDFTLEPRQTQVVEITIDVPINADSGEYFGYLEAGVKNADSISQDDSNVSIGIAAATKLYFDVDNSGLGQSVFERANLVYQDYRNYFLVGGGLLFILLIFLIVRRFFTVKVGVRTNSQAKQSTFS